MTDRRSFLRGTSVLLAHAALGNVLSAFAAAPRKATFFSEPEMRALQAVVDVARTYFGGSAERDDKIAGIREAYRLVGIG